MTVEDTVKQLKCDEELTKSGLTTAQAASRLAEFGPNKMTEARKKTLLERIWAQVANVLVGILVFVAVVSAIRAITADNSDDIVTNWIQVGIIVGVITVNTWIGIVQEGSAEEAAEALKNMLSSDALVVRDGKEVMIPAEELVPGDLVVLGLGDKVPCDMLSSTLPTLPVKRLLLLENLSLLTRSSKKLRSPKEETPIQHLLETVAT